MKYAGREAFRAIDLQITKSGVKKIMRPKDGEEVVFRLNQPGSRAKTVKGRIATFQQHGLLSYSQYNFLKDIIDS